MQTNKATPPKELTVLRFYVPLDTNRLFQKESHKQNLSLSILLAILIF